MVNEVRLKSRRSSHIPLHDACACSAHQRYDLIYITMLHFDTLAACAIMSPEVLKGLLLLLI